MYSFLHKLLADQTGGEVFTCFSLWHFVYVILAVGTLVVSILLLKDKDQTAKDKAMKLFSGIAFGLYMADFFLMPFAYGTIYVEKLPFHACTATAVLCFASNHSTFLKKYRRHFALLGFLANFCYLVYPAGVAWCAIAPYSYRAVQTLLFHGVMVVYTVLAMTFDEEGMNIRRSYRDLAILGGMTVWALIGNIFYDGTEGDYTYASNWFFLKSDPFGALPASVAPYVLPFLNIAVFFAAEILIYLVFMAIDRAKGKRALPLAA